MPERVTPAVNFRPVGCRDDACGRGINLYRSGTLSGLSEHEALRLRNRTALSAFVDLRSRREVAQNGRPTALEQAGVRYVHVPVEHHDNEAIASLWPSPRNYAEYYVSMIEHASTPIVAALDALAATDGRPAAFGCYAGKDRTGIVSLALLEISGVGLSQRKADYVRTNSYLRRSGRTFERSWNKRGLTRSEYLHRISAKEQTLDVMYQLLVACGGGVVPVLRQRGLTHATVSLLRERMSSQLAWASTPARLEYNA